MAIVAESILIICVIVTMLYHILFRSGFRRYRSYAVLDQTRGVSIIIAAHNEEKNLKELVPRLLSQVHDNFEIIIADDRSSDGSYEYVSSLQDERIRIIRVDHSPKGINTKKNALNIAIGLASKELLLLTDADCVPLSQNWIAWIAGNYQPDTEFVIGYSGYEERPGFLNKYIRFETIFTAIQYIGLGLTTGPYMGVGRNLSYKREVFNQNAGYGKMKSITGGDDDLFVNRYATKTNTQFVIEKEAQTISKPKTSWASYYIQKRRHLSVGKYYKTRDLFILSAFSFSNLAFWVTFVYNSITGALLIALLGYLFRLLTFSLTFSTAASKLGEHYNKWWLPIMDFVFWIYNSFTAVSALTTKRVSWS